MSKFIRYPNGFIGSCNDKVAEVLAARPGHAIVRIRPDSEEAKRLAERVAAKKSAEEADNA
jgi:hypothetical protein